MTRSLVVLWLAGCAGSATDNCPPQDGEVLCGQCDGWTTGPHSGQCRYCSTGYHCCGDLCAEWDQGLSCTAGSGEGNTTNGSNGPAGGTKAGVCGGSSGVGGGSGGSCGDSQHQLATCPNGTSMCCSVNQVCCYDSANNGAIGCEFQGFCQ